MPRAQVLTKGILELPVVAESTVTVHPVWYKDVLVVRRSVTCGGGRFDTTHEITATTGDLLKELVDEYRQDRRLANAL